MIIKEIEGCRICGSKNLKYAFSLGVQKVKDFTDEPSQNYISAPLDLILCSDCKLIQLKHTFDKSFLYTHYWYRSATSPTMVKELKNIVELAESIVSLAQGDIVVDIGSNDGTLLKQYQTPGLCKIGFEPSNLSKYGEGQDIEIINEFFNDESLSKATNGRKVNVFTSIAMFYDLDDPNDFVRSIKKHMSDDGVWIVQMNYLALMIKNLGFDNICHEHVAYYSLGTFMKLLESHGLEIFDVTLNNVNGGSFRTLIKHKHDKSKKINSQGIESIIKEEERLGLEKIETYLSFQKTIQAFKASFLKLIKGILEDGKTIMIYGASTRGLVILEYCGIDERIVKLATDKNSDKWGKYLSGTGIKIVPLDTYRKIRPDYLLVLPYQYVNEIFTQERDFINGGGKIIIPLPEPRILEAGYGTEIGVEESSSFLPGYDKI